MDSDNLLLFIVFGLTTRIILNVSLAGSSDYGPE